MQELKLSASAIEAFKSCPARFLLSYEYGFQPDKKKDSLRIGENWHRCHEILHMKPKTKCPDCLRREEIRADCYLCDGTGVLPADLMDAVIRFLNYAYARIPDHKTKDEWEAERIKILYSVSGYYWHYGWEDEFETIGVEVWFDCPIINPNTGRKLPKARMIGKVDRLARHKKTGLIYIFERKSTSKNLTDSTYWNRLKSDDQITTYLYFLRYAQLQGDLRDYGVEPDEPLIHGTFYDVWSKPGINLKWLSQKDSKEFVELGKYCGQEFAVGWIMPPALDIFEKELYANNKKITINPGKKEGTFKILETPEMYGARLLQDISQQPEVYFAQREIGRTDQQLEKYQRDLANLVKLIRYFEENNCWYEHDRMCESPYRCDFLSIYNTIGCLNVNPEESIEGYRRKNANT